VVTDTIDRASRIHVDCLPLPVDGNSLGRGCVLDSAAEYLSEGAALCPRRGSGQGPRKQAIAVHPSHVLMLSLQIIDEIRHSVSVLHTLPDDVQSSARHVYYEALKYCFWANTAVAAIALVSAIFARGKGLDRD